MSNRIKTGFKDPRIQGFQREKINIEKFLHLNPGSLGPLNPVFYRVKRNKAREAKMSPKTLDTVTGSCKKIKPKMAGIIKFKLKMGMTMERGPRAMAV